MVYKVVFLYSLLGFHSVYPLSEIKVQLFEARTSLQNKVGRLSSSICAIRKCPPGHSSVCHRKTLSRCVPCKKGTFSSHPSRRRVCRPCSRCRNDEYEIRPCTPISNVMCGKCSQCPPGFEAEITCGETRDTVCKKGGRENNTVRELQMTNGTLPFDGRKKGNQEQKAEGALFVKVQVENPRLNSTSQPKYAVESSAGQETRSASPNWPTPSIVSFTSHRVAGISSPITDLSGDTFATEVVTESSQISGTSTKYSLSSSPASKTQSDFTNRDSIDIQLGKPNIPRHTRRNVEHNRTGKGTPSLKSHLSSISLEDIQIKTMFVRPVTGALPEATKTFSSRPEVDKIPLAEKPETGRSKHFVYLYLAFGAIAILIVGILILAAFKQHRARKGPFFSCKSTIKHRRPRCPDCCDGNSVSSATDSNAAQDDCRTSAIVHIGDSGESQDLSSSPQPTLVTHVLTADVHRSVFEVFPAIRGLNESLGSYPQYVTRAEAMFNSSGGRLCAPYSNVAINVESGAVPDGISQPVYFGVVYDDTLLLRDIPETLERSLISPVIKCGPEDLNLLKPVEIVLPHCLCIDEVKKSSISVYRCQQFSEEGPMKWEKVPPEKGRKCQSQAWFTVKRNTIHIKTKRFSFWSVFCCGGPKRKRATVFVSKPNPQRDLLHLRFYIYSDNEDSRRRMARKEKEQFPDSKPTMEKPFKLYNDTNNITVWLSPEELAKNGWEMDQTPATQTYLYEMAYKNGYRTYESCNFAVKPIGAIQGGLNDFSCSMFFQQEDHPEHFIYVNPGISLNQQMTLGVCAGSRESSHNNSAICAENSSETQTERNNEECPVTESTHESDEDEEENGLAIEPVTQHLCSCICEDIGIEWKTVLRKLGMKETTLRNLDEDNKNCKVAEKCYQGLLKWMESDGQETATNKKLRQALRLVGCSEALETLSRQVTGNQSPDLRRGRKSTEVSPIVMGR